VVEPLAVVVEPVVAMVFGETPSAVSHVTVPMGYAAITRLVIPSIDLDTAVVPAALVEHDGMSTWEIPRFVAGHAEGSAGAGEAGNAILIGHITSITLGHVFETLDRVSSGDAVTVFSSDRLWGYRVSDVRNVARTDLGPLEPTSSPRLTLITCSGTWLPTVHDYAQRLVVTAEFVP
jgi:LPXTG-site transpeptidase (sortase) family protein